ncbi:MAG: transposase [Nitrospinae bacterium]|nr:transposase [Nitrospinota bacterium]
MGRLTHPREDGACYHVTSTTDKWHPFFRDHGCAQDLWDVINAQRQRGRFNLLAFAIMPDHLHLLLMPSEGATLGLIMREIKKGSARMINRRLGRRGKVWMDRYYDHGVRGVRELCEKVAYIHGNPVREGIVEEASAYRFSSANPVFDGALWKDW